MRKSEKYLIGRMDKGADCCNSETFVLDSTVKKVVEMYGREQIKKAEKAIQKMPSIKGVPGLISKAEAVAVIQKLLNDEFILPNT